jgi:Family of unknown function (DUF6127)
MTETVTLRSSELLALADAAAKRAVEQVQIETAVEVAQEAAREAVHELFKGLGIDDERAGYDMRDLRSLIKAIREAKRRIGWALFALVLVVCGWSLQAHIKTWLGL